MRIVLFLLFFLASPAFACGPDSDCPVGDRHYRISMPDGHNGTTPVPALIWSHGYRGSAAGVMRNTAMRNMLSKLGFALIAAQGVGGTWDLPYGPRTFDSDGAAEFAYFDAVIADVTENHHIDPGRIVASGFSAGGMMVWNLACSHPQKFAGFVPMSGTFWLKPPDTCDGPVRSLVHIHGTNDKTVPLKGRAIGETKQGEVEDALAQFVQFGGFGPTSYFKAEALTCRQRANDTGQFMQYCLFEGGHSFSVRMLEHGLVELLDVGGI